MSIRVRRGTDTQRLSVILEEGEIAYTTDTKKFYVGDGITLGGTEVGAGTVASVTASSPLSSSGGANPNITIQDALADGSTKGAASFNASDFNASSGVISIDYTNGQSASGISKGFLTSADWTAFNNKLDPFPVGNFAELTSSVLNITGGSSSIIGAGITVEVKQSSATQGGYLSSADWSTFNGKQNALTFGNLTESTSSVLTITGGTGSVIGSGTSIQVKQANATQSGFLSSTDWTTFNGKQNALTNPVTGTGTNNEIAFFNTTGSTIGSLSTATYPSLTELSYVKGVTSDIQTQLNGKQGALTLTTTGTSGASTLVGNTLNIPQYSGGGGTDSVNWTMTESFPSLGSTIKAEPATFSMAYIQNSAFNIISQRIYLLAIWVPRAMTITGVKYFQSTIGVFTPSNFNGVALYTYSSGTFTRVAVSTNDGTMLSTGSTNSLKQKAFSSTYSATAGLYYAAILYSSSAVTTSPSLIVTANHTFQSFTLDTTNSQYWFMFAVNQTTMPTTLTIPGQFSTVNTPYLALY